MGNFSCDDRGNVVDFWEKMKDGTWEKVAVLDRECGENCDESEWLNESGDELEKWAKNNGYKEEIFEAKRIAENRKAGAPFDDGNRLE